MASSPTTGETRDVPTQVFQQFLQTLGSTNVPANVVASLREALLEDKKYTESALKQAVLDEDRLT